MDWAEKSNFPNSHLLLWVFYLVQEMHEFLYYDWPIFLCKQHTASSMDNLSKLTGQGWSHKQLYPIFTFLWKMLYKNRRTQQPNVHQLKNGKIKYGNSHTMEYHSTMKRNEVLTRATTRMNPESIMLSEKSQSWKITYPMTLYEIRTGKSVETESRLGVA